eukprot:TRINITY_DN34147_c0_g1_i1.p1 TRINITY_DN34147_c0_g1~~TRINITY_DN34147_c0_g1_i1.p1  ORF type:complete len:1125 (+),score=306.70 TRINITY_DN34147_c0_g1_i1:38-3412(+)
MKCANGSWCDSVTPLKHAKKEYSASRFVDELRFQMTQYQVAMEDQAMSLSKKQESVANKNKEFGFHFAKDVDISIDDKMFDAMCEMQKDEEYCPLLTFHGTSSVDVVNSILKHGYLLPGEPHPVLGNMHYSQHGSYYGMGVYTSTKKEMSALYNTVDAEGSTYLLLNIVMLGNVEWLKHGRQEGEVVPNSENVYEGNVHTRALPDLLEVISADPKRVFPVGYVCIKARDWATHHYNNTSGRLTTIGRHYDTYSADLPAIEAKLIARNYYLLLPKEKKAVKYPTVHHVVVTGAFLKSNIKAFTDFVSRANEKTVFYICGKTTEVFECKNASHLHSKRGTFTSSKKPNILCGLAAAMEACNSSGLNVVYFFVHDAKEKRETTKFVNTWHPVVANLKLHLKLIFEDEEHDNSLFELKTLDTMMSSWGDYFRYHTTQTKDYMNTLLDSNARVQLSTTTYKIPCHDGIFGEGFLHDLTANPSWDTSTSAVTILKDSKGLKVIEVDGQLVQLSYNEKEKWSSSEVDALFTCLSGILSKLRLFALTDRARYIKYMPALSIFCDKVSSIIETTPERFSTLKSMHYLISKYVNEFAMMSKVPFKGRLFERFQSLKHGKRIVKRVKDIDIALLEKEIGKKVESLEDLLPLLENIKGYGMLTLDSDASKVEPWNLMVGHVSGDIFSFAEVYRNKELGTRLLDSDKKKINNILVTSDITPQLKKVYLAYLFTGNPYLFVPSQASALYTTVFVHLLENILVQATKGLNFRIEEKLALAGTLLHKARPSKALLEGLEGTTNIEAYLTEGNEMTSTNMIFVLLRDKEVYKQLASKRFVFALLCESVMRACKTYCKVLKTSRTKIFEMLIGDSGLNTAKAKNVSGKFYQRRFASNSPFSIVSVLEYLDRIHSGVSIAEVAMLYEKREISMKNFLCKYYCEEEGTSVQIALFLQGLLYNKSLLRQKMSKFEPVEVINASVEKHKEHQKMVKCLAEAREKAKDHRQKTLLERRLRKIEDMQEYVDAHEGWPEVFTVKEVADINATRGPTKQLKLRPNGLLANTCCFKHCPNYMTMMTESDVYHHVGFIHIYLRGDFIKAHNASLKLSKTSTSRGSLQADIKKLTRDAAEAEHLTDFYLSNQH